MLYNHTHTHTLTVHIDCDFLSQLGHQFPVKVALGFTHIDVALRMKHGYIGPSCALVESFVYMVGQLVSCLFGRDTTKVGGEPIYDARKVKSVSMVNKIVTGFECH